jgi:hypothetical protein
MTPESQGILAGRGQSHVSPKITIGQLFAVQFLNTYVFRYVSRTESPNHAPYGLLQPLPIPEERWKSVSMDFIAPLPKTKRGNSGILVVLDRLFKTQHVIPTPSSCTALATANSTTNL